MQIILLQKINLLSYRMILTISFYFTGLLSKIIYLHCRQYTTDYKLETYLKIARLYLEDADPVQAEAYINRASLLQTDSQNQELQIHYKVIKNFFINQS